jgi:hypothetical protein
MVPVETLTGMGEEVIKENDGWGDFDYVIFHIL